MEEQDYVVWLIRKLTRPDWKDRLTAAETLGRIGPKAAPAVPALSRAVKDPNRAVRLEAAQALGRIRDRAAIPALCKALEDETEDEVIIFLVRSLIRLGVDIAPAAALLQIAPLFIVTPHGP